MTTCDVTLNPPTCFQALVQVAPPSTLTSTSEVESNSISVHGREVSNASCGALSWDRSYAGLISSVSTGPQPSAQSSAMAKPPPPPVRLPRLSGSLNCQPPLPVWFTTDQPSGVDGWSKDCRPPPWYVTAYPGAACSEAWSTGNATSAVTSRSASFTVTVFDW